MKSVYPHIIPDIEQWPIHQIHTRRAEFIKELNAYSKDRLLSNTKMTKLELLEKTVYLEKIRVKNNPWSVDPADDKTHWKELQKEINDAKQHEDSEPALELILDRVINRYNEEIVGNFKKKTFKFARRFLTSFFKRLLNPARGKGQRWLWGNRKNVQSRIKVDGYVNELRSLFEKGTVVIVPTHFSNLDSAIIGYSLDAVVGIPAFSYGAGLNLYDMELVAYLINRLGAYRVDRRKKNPIYLECLKSMASYSIQSGLNQIFFPGGTRSRSGSLEEKLKLGLLGSVVEAQRRSITDETNKKIFVVPMILGYHFVLEGKFMIDQHLRSQSKEKYRRSKDQFKSYRKILKFIWSVFKEQGDIQISFGEPMDVFGNMVDNDGNSVDKKGEKVDISGYFQIDGELKAEQQREKVYTKILGDRIVDSYKRNNVVLTSHLISYTAFNIILAQNEEMSLYDVLNSSPEDFTISKADFLDKMNILLVLLKKEEKEGRLRLAEELGGSVESILKHGLANLGIYHINDVLFLDKEDNIKTNDIRLLYFYHNRMTCYDLISNPRWQRKIIQTPIPESNLL